MPVRGPPLAGGSDSHASDGRCKQYTAPHAQHLLMCGSRLSPRLNVKHRRCPLKRIDYPSRASCLVRTRRRLNTIFLTTLHPSQLHHTVPLFFYNLTVTTQYHRIHGQRDCSGEWPYKVRSQVMSPNTTVEISSAEVTPIHPPSRRAFSCPVYNSGEDATITPVSSEVGERQSMGMLASPLFAHA